MTTIKQRINRVKRAVWDYILGQGGYAYKQGREWEHAAFCRLLHGALKCDDLRDDNIWQLLNQVDKLVEQRDKTGVPL
jgi:alpha-D-ribose 1-methylphosphonate 5-triphosphate synthase subunit PhnG